MTPEERLNTLGITLPEAIKPLGSYIPTVRVGELIFLSGVLPLKEGRLLKIGKVGSSLTLEEAQEAARLCIINALSILRDEIGSLDNVKRCIRLTGYIASEKDFIEQPKVLNPASDLLVEVFGEAGRHSRVAVGVASLPLDSPIEIELIFAVGGS
jgi:enamine deaminase RidA (YjgF/YER057c/UK114 family)